MSEIRLGTIESVYLTPVSERRSGKHRQPSSDAKHSTETERDNADSDKSPTLDSPATSPISIDVFA